MARVKQDLLVALEAAGLVDRVGADRIYPDIADRGAGLRRLVHGAAWEAARGVRSDPHRPAPSCATDKGWV